MAYGSVLTDTVQSSTAATAPVFKDGNGTQIGTLCRAWVNFNGTGTVAIRASFNVSSITDNGTGNYTVNFTTAMPDTNYATLTTGETATAYIQGTFLGGTYSTSAVQVRFYNGSIANTDPSNANVAIFR